MSIDLLVGEAEVAGMARKPRIDFPGAFYHVIVRGNQRATIVMARLITPSIWSASNAIAAAMASRSMPTC